MTETAFALIQKDDEAPLPLLGAAASVELTAALAHTTVTQRYRNAGTETIEAVYAFPLPTEAVLLGLEIRIGGRTLKGVVDRKRKAENRYEDALAEGDGAFLLRELRPGLYQMSVGNLKPGEETEISVHFAQALRWNGDRLRYRLPTVVAPHYGAPERAGIEAHEAPKTHLLASYSLSFDAALSGTLGRATVECPTHPIALTREGEMLRVTLADPAATLDRELVLIVRALEPAPLEVWTAPDGDAVAALACLHAPAFANVKTTSAHDLTIVLDCSGSMAGDSIVQARRALLAIADLLGDGDRVSVLRFGSTVVPWTEAPVAVDDLSRQRLRQFAADLEADLGGTELLSAVDAALAATPEGGDILLVSDDLAHTRETEVRQRAVGGRRFFTVAVGSAGADFTARLLAEHSGGACVTVTPNERMSEAIVDHFRRMRTPRAALTFAWNAPVQSEAGHRRAIFERETLLAFARLEATPSNGCRAAIAFGNDSLVLEATPAVATGRLAEALPRLVAWQRLAGLDDEAATDLAVRYQLLTGHTAMVAVHERAEADKATGIPVRVDVHQMLNAGYGGLGSTLTVNGLFADLVGSSHRVNSGDHGLYEELAPPNVCRQEEPGLNPRTEDLIPSLPEYRSRTALIDFLNSPAGGRVFGDRPDGCTRIDLTCIPPAHVGVAQALKALIEQHPGEEPAIALALIEFLLDRFGRKGSHRHLRRRAAETRKTVTVPEDLRAEVEAALERVLNPVNLLADSGLHRLANWFTRRR